MEVRKRPSSEGAIHVGPAFLLNSLLTGKRTPFSIYLRSGMALHGPMSSEAMELFPIPAPFEWSPIMRAQPQEGSA